MLASLRFRRCDIRELCFSSSLSITVLGVCQSVSILNLSVKLWGELGAGGSKSRGNILITTTGACILRKRSQEPLIKRGKDVATQSEISALVGI